MMRGKYLRMFSAGIFALLLAGLVSCGGGRAPSAQLSVVSGQGSAETGVAPPFQAARPSETTLNEALAQLDALPTPEGVDAALFAELKSALRDALVAKSVSKLVSEPPIGPSNSVDDLALIDNGDGTYTLTWSYRNVGDYNQDSIVGISDLTPLAAHFNEEADATNEWIDGNGDGAITILDITPLAAGFFSEVAGYSIQGDDDPGGTFPEIDRVGFTDATGEGRLRFSFDLPALSNVLYRVVPFDSASAEGEHSGVVSTSEMAFHPREDTEIDGGSYDFSTANIPPDVTVTVLGDVSFHGSGDIVIDGTLIADGSRLEIVSEGNIIITGTVDNSTDSDPDEPGDLIIHSNGGEITLGTEDTPATIQSSGDIDIADAPDLEEWELDVLPDERSATPLPPVCSASADILHDTVLPDLPVEIAFLGEGADPDGGPVSYEWDFGDGSASSTERDPVHEYTSWGVYDVVLTVTDDDAESSQASLRILIDDGEENIPESPGVCIEPTDIVVGVDEEVPFSSDAADAQGQELTYNWDFGDMETSSEPNPAHAYTADGRYEVTLTVTDSDTNESTATASVYVYSASATSSVSQAGAPRLWNARAAIQPPVAPRPGRRGRGIIGRGRGNIIFGAASSVQAQDGADGVSRSGVRVRGGNGGRGGSLQVLIAGTLTVRGGATFHSGDGGDGGNATATAPPGAYAYARGGNGGNAGRLLRLAATQGITFLPGASVVMDPGSGGNGGFGDATGGDGAAQCPRGQDGGRATAYGGKGGKGSKTVTVRGNVVGLGNVEIQGGRGGEGGIGIAWGGDGGAATCATTATGGNGKRAYARGGRGGDARLSGAFAGFGAIAADAFKAGDGGMGEASGGGGGSATANPPGPTTANGGDGGKGTAVGGNGGRGYRNGIGADANAWGGAGGTATALPENGAPCEDGKSATATGGNGGDARATKGRKGGAPAGDGTANANAGAGGLATATGGNGGSCDTCPAGDGGNGADGTATGGDGGDGTGNGNNTGGTGGNADAFGGDGGNGASCCVKFFEQQGGDGGDGGDATSTAGHGGTPGSVRGSNFGRAGDGGDGGDGWGFGLKGLKGIGTGNPNDVNDGVDGVDGALCPPWTIWYVYLSTIAPGPIVPGSAFDLDVYLDDKSTKTGYTVEAYFLTEAEFGAPVDYSKEGDFLFVNSGRVEFDLSTLPGTFPVGKVDVQIDHSSMEPGAIQLIGYYEGGYAAVGNTAGTGDPVHETLELPPAPGDTPYLGFALEAYNPVSVECWWIEIIDP